MMVEKKAEDISGLEYDWLASDADTHVAFFSTAGGGFAPEEFLRNPEIHDASIEAILALPTRTQSLFAPELPQDRLNTWKLIAERGFYAFDSDPHGGPYRIVAAPKQPVRSSDLPEDVASVVRQLALPRLRFADVTVISADTLRQHCAPTHRA